MTVASRPPAGIGIRPDQARAMLCHYCTAPFTTAKPQDPEQDPGDGTCPGCRRFAAEEWAEKNKVALSVAITRFTRYA